MIRDRANTSGHAKPSTQVRLRRKRAKQGDAGERRDGTQKREGHARNYAPIMRMTNRYRDWCYPSSALCSSTYHAKSADAIGRGSAVSAVKRSSTSATGGPCHTEPMIVRRRRLAGSRVGMNGPSSRLEATIPPEKGMGPLARPRPVALAQGDLNTS